MDICHITLTAERKSRLPLFPDEATYLEALHRLGEVCQGCLALFALIAEHLHLIAARSRMAGGRLAQAVSLTLRPIVATPLAPGYPTMVETRDHIRNLLRYALLQALKHGMPGHPALWVGSCAPDLLGARVIQGLTLCVKRVLPDYTDSRVLAIVGLPGRELAVAGRDTLRAAGAYRLKLAAAASFGVDPTLAGNTPAARLARRAMVSIGHRVGIPVGELAHALGITTKAAGRLKRRPVERDAMAVIARRVSLENLVYGGLRPPISPGGRSPADFGPFKRDRSRRVAGHPLTSVPSSGTDLAR